MNKWNKIPFTESIVKNKTSVSSVNASDYLETGVIPVIDQSVDFIAGYTNKAERVVSKDLLPVIVFGDHTRVLKYIDFPFVTGADGTKLLFPNKSLFNSKFFYYNLLSKPLPNRGYNRHYKLLQELTIDLPTQTQQHVIVHILDILDKKINLIKNELKKYKQLKQSLMEKLFREGISKGKLVNTELGHLPIDWKLVKINDIAKIKGGKRLPKGQKLLKEKTSYPYIRVSDFNKNTVDINNIQFLTEETYKQISNYTIAINDVFISIAGTIGVVGMIPEVLNGANLTENAAKLVIDTKTPIKPRFLMYWLATRTVQKIIQTLTVKNAQPKLALTRIATLPVVIPSINEQEEIIDILDSLQLKITNTERCINTYQKLFENLLSKLMNQEIEVSNLEFENA
jgi:type I restriction enzyme S subunit